MAAHDVKTCSCRASRRPGTRDDKTQPNLSPSLAQWTIQRIRLFICQSKLDIHWNHVPAAVVPCHSDCGYFLSRFASVLLWRLCRFWKTAGVHPKISFCQTIILPECYFARISCCQNSVMPKYQDWVFPNISLPQFVRKLMGQKVRKITIWVVPEHHILYTHWGWWFQWNRRPLW